MAALLPGRVLFLAHPRTGSIATREAIKRMGGIDIPPHHSRLHDDAVQRLHKGEPVVTTVRNPYDVVATWWCTVGQRKPRAYPTLADFIQKHESKHFCDGGLLFYHLPHADVVLRYEDGIAQGFARLGIELPLELENTTKGKADWRTYYDAAAYEAMAARFGPEIDSLGYEVVA